MDNPVLNNELWLVFMIIYNGNWTVYVHINKINGKMYVGITSKELKHRFRSNGLGYKSCSHFWHAIQKYGWNNFDHEIIASHLTEDEACNMEKLLIKKLNLTDQSVGYNISEGGNKGCLLTGNRHWVYGKHLSEETRKKISEAKKGTTFLMPESAKEKIRKALTGNHNGKCTKVFCVETGILYESAAEASRETGFDPSQILSCARGRGKTVHKTHWKLAA